MRRGGDDRSYLQWKLCVTAGTTKIFRISTDDLSYADHAESFCADFAKVIFNIEISLPTGKSLDFDMTFQGLPGLGIAAGTTSPTFCRHKPEWASNDDFVLSIVQSCTATRRHHGREIGASAGQALLTEQGRPAPGRAHRLLAMPGPDRTISAVAFDCGFGDLSYFNRAFRRHYGATPSDIRAAAKKVD
jgi:AraC-like DNA-binding protein